MKRWTDKFTIANRTVNTNPECCQVALHASFVTSHDDPFHCRFSPELQMFEKEPSLSEPIDTDLPVDIEVFWVGWSLCLEHDLCHIEWFAHQVKAWVLDVIFHQRRVPRLPVIFVDCPQTLLNLLLPDFSVNNIVRNPLLRNLLCIQQRCNQQSALLQNRSVFWLLHVRKNSERSRGYWQPSAVSERPPALVQEIRLRAEFGNCETQTVITVLQMILVCVSIPILELAA